MVQSNLLVRSLQPKDFTHLMELYEKARIEGIQFVRSGNFLKYFIQYHGVEADSVLVAEDKGEITGLAIISITSEIGGLRQGSIIEFLATNSRSTRALIRTAIDYCSEKDVDLLVAVPPPSLHERERDELFKEWIKFETNVMMTKTLSLSSLLQALLSYEKIRDSYVGKKVVFQVDRDMVEARIDANSIEVKRIEGRARQAELWVSASSQNFLRIIFGQLNPYAAYLMGRIRIRGIKNARQGLKLLGMMRLTAPFYTSLADRL